jgi:hypothetical protein
MGGNPFCVAGKPVCRALESWASPKRPESKTPSSAIIKSIQRVFMMFLHLRSDTCLEYNHAQPFCHAKHRLCLSQELLIMQLEPVEF